MIKEEIISPLTIKSQSLVSGIFEKLCAVEGIFFNQTDKEELNFLNKSNLNSEEKIQEILKNIKSQ